MNTMMVGGMREFRRQQKARLRKEPITIAAVVVAGAAVAGGFIQANAAKQAAKTAAAAQDRAIASNERLAAQQRADAAPFVNAGTRANRTLSGEAFITPEEARAQGIPEDDPRVRTPLALDDPLFQFQLEQGERAINRFLSGRGQFFSGLAAEQLSNFNLEASGIQINRDIARNQNLADRGANVLTANAQQSTNIGLANAGLTAQQGNTLAQGTLGAANAQAGAIAGAGQAFGTGIQNQAVFNAFQGNQQQAPPAFTQQPIPSASSFQSNGGGARFSGLF